jgi:hypothetical protein
MSMPSPLAVSYRRWRSFSKRLHHDPVQFAPDDDAQAPGLGVTLRRDLAIVSVLALMRVLGLGGSTSRMMRCISSVRGGAELVCRRTAWCR